MNSRCKRIGLLVCLLAGTVLFVNAQATKTSPLNFRDVDGEARNAYQNHCSISTAGREIICVFPPLPAGKRLAIRWFSVFCHDGGFRVAGIELSHPLFDSGDDIFGLTTRFRTLQPFVFNERILEEPMYAHSDTAPSVRVLLNEAANTSTSCDFSVRGFLVDKQ